MSKLMPKKHISLEQSLIGFGTKIIKLIGMNTVSLEFLWQNCNLDCAVKHSFDDLILTLDYLFAIGIVKQDEEGWLCLN